MFSTAHTEPKISVNYKFYDIYPKSFNDIDKEMYNKTPILKNGARYRGYTDWHVKWSYSWQNKGNYCKLTSVSTRLDVTYTMPKIPDNFKVNSKILSVFNNYYKALINHEYGHKDSGLFAARDIEKELIKLSSSKGCKNLASTANSKAQKIIKKYTQRDLYYDKHTQHGKTQGVDINNFISN